MIEVCTSSELTSITSIYSILETFLLYKYKIYYIRLDETHPLSTMATASFNTDSPNTSA